jgi:hypothetical protein
VKSKVQGSRYGGVRKSRQGGEVKMGRGKEEKYIAPAVKISMIGTGSKIKSPDGWEARICSGGNT